jgi:hypothetical protein
VNACSKTTRRAAFESQILASGGATLHAELHGVAVGFSERGTITTLSAGLEVLTPQQLQDLGRELTRLATELERGQYGLTH